jgi:CheY-like chemotaxis protein
MERKRILIADDESLIRMDLQEMLTNLGYLVVGEASNGIDALNMARDLKPDLVIMDVRMPRMTGYEACRRLKASPETKEIPVVFLSAKGQDAEVQEGLEAGAIDYILKPFSPDELTRRVSEILQSLGKA